MGAEDLVQVLRGLAPVAHPWIRDEVAPMEDAALLRPETGPPLAFTVDFITPIVDDPRAFGAIAAANSLSDIYAMGGDPAIALCICGYPDDKISLETLGLIFQGGQDKATEAGCAIAGGHTVIDPELKYGLCVLGSVDPAKLLSQTRARAGDRLVLTKPIGTGIAAQAVKAGKLSDAELEMAIDVMSTLNAGARDAAHVAGARAATDVTGFGLLGHLHHLASASGLEARVTASAVPTFPFALPLARSGTIPGGSRKNLRYVEGHCRWEDGIDDSERLVLCDAQTSGGLLLAVPADATALLVRELESRHCHAAAVIGELFEGEAGHIDIQGRG